MATYIVLRTNPDMLGGINRVEAVLVEDDRELIILGETRIAEELRDRQASELRKHPQPAGLRAGFLLHGYDYHYKEGPYDVPDSTARAIANSFVV